MQNLSMRTALRISSAAVLISLAACGDNVATGVDGAALKSGSSAAGSASSSSSSSSTGGVQTGRVQIALTRPAGAAFATAKGKAKYSNRGGERELEIEAENIPAGTAVEFVLDGAVIGTGTATALREVELNLNSDRGATVPASVAGKSVSVRTAAGAAIVSGSF
jgi:hypothetical protein